ncbi:hypothetical protein J6P92_07695 [bacterium]|nr:hypothetical protein [bacterium]
MKKILVLFMLIILTCGCTIQKKSEPVNKSGLEILPLMSSESVYNNRIWVGTFQLVWNDLMDELVKGDVEFAGGTPDIVKGLNRQEFKASDLSENSYYKKWGKASFTLRDEIKKGIKEKFNETSDIISSIDWSPAPSKYVIYAMLKKDFKFLHAFDKLEPEKFGYIDTKVDYFGIKPENKDVLAENIGVLFYNSKNDFAVKLHTQGNDAVYLYRTNDDKTFDKIYSDMTAKTEKYEGRKWFGDGDYFKAPFIKLYQEKLFDEVCGRHIIGTDLMIDKALETVDFSMDNEGVKLKSEAVIVTMKSAMPGRIIEPRYFYFNDTFYLFLQEKYKKQPYFAMRIDDVIAYNQTAKK